MSNRRKTKAERQERSRFKCGHCGSGELIQKPGYGVICQECGAKQNPERFRRTR